MTISDSMMVGTSVQYIHLNREVSHTSLTATTGRTFGKHCTNEATVITTQEAVCNN